MCDCVCHDHGSLIPCEDCKETWNEEKAKDTLRVCIDALITILNVEGAASRAEQWIPVDKGLEVRWHFDQVRKALRVADPNGHMECIEWKAPR